MKCSGFFTPFVITSSKDVKKPVWETNRENLRIFTNLKRLNLDRSIIDKKKKKKQGLNWIRNWKNDLISFNLTKSERNLMLNDDFEINNKIKN